MKTYLKVFLFFSFTIVIVSCSNNQKEGASTSTASIEKVKNTFSIDFEKFDVFSNSGVIVPDVAHSGKNSSKLPGKDSYSSAITLKVKNLDYSNISKVKLSLWYYPQEKDIDGVFVVNIKDTVSKKDVSWKGVDIKSNSLTPNTWVSINGEIALSKEDMNPNNIILIYVWNRNTFPFYVDDMNIEMW